MLVRLLALVLVLASGACRCGKEAEPVAARATEPPDSTAEGGLPFIRDDYNPPARLAEVYLRLGRLDEALAACNRALEKVYGPRKARVLNLQGEIFRARGEYQKARMAHEAALIVNGRLPEVQQSGREVFRAQKGLLELEKLR